MRPVSTSITFTQKPAAAGGNLENLVPACAFCNTSKKAKTVEEFRAAPLVKVMNALNESADMLERFKNQLPARTRGPTYASVKSIIADLRRMANADISSIEIRFYGDSK